MRKRRLSKPASRTRPCLTSRPGTAVRFAPSKLASSGSASSPPRSEAPTTETTHRPRERSAARQVRVAPNLRKLARMSPSSTTPVLQPNGPTGQRGESTGQPGRPEARPSGPMRQPRGPIVQPIVIWFGRVGDLVLLSTLFDILHRRYGKQCRLVGAGAWTAAIYRKNRDVAQISCIRRYTPYVFDLTWWRTLWALRRNRTGPVYV